MNLLTLPLPSIRRSSDLHSCPTRRSSDLVFYAESWALVHYLLLAENQKYFRRAGEFVDELARGRSLAEACSGVLQTTPGALERSEEHTSELQSRLHVVCRLLLEKSR